VAYLVGSVTMTLFLRSIGSLTYGIYVFYPTQQSSEYSSPILRGALTPSHEWLGEDGSRNIHGIPQETSPLLDSNRQRSQAVKTRRPAVWLLISAVIAIII